MAQYISSLEFELNTKEKALLQAEKRLMEVEAKWEDAEARRLEAEAGRLEAETGRLEAEAKIFILQDRPTLAKEKQKRAQTLRHQLEKIKQEQAALHLSLKKKHSS